MPHYRKHNDAVRYPTPIYVENEATWETFLKLCDSLKETSNYKMITLDSWSYAPEITINPNNAIAKIIQKGEWG